MDRTECNTMNSLGHEYSECGVAILRNALSSSHLQIIRSEIMGVIEEAYGQSISYESSGKSFVEIGTRLLWEIVSKEPNKRNLIYSYVQRIPSLFEFGNSPLLRKFAASIGMKKPSVREFKVQMYLPWEKIFLQDCHQDINSLDSDNSVTFWIPLHDIDESAAVTYWVGSHKGGPVRHQAQYIEEEAIFFEVVPPEVRAKYPVTRKAVVREGDIIAVNRLVFHSSPQFEAQRYARWIILVRYDDIAGNGLYSDTTKYAEFTPTTLTETKAHIAKIQAILAQPPRVNWIKKLDQMEG